MKFIQLDNMENYNEMSIDLLLKQELVKFKGLMEQIRETNEKYENITTRVKTIESKFSATTDLSNYVDLIDYKSERDIIDSQFGLIKKAQIDLNKQFSEFNYLFSKLTPKLEEKFDAKISQLVSIDSFDKGIAEIEHKIGNTINDINKYYENLNTKITDFQSKLSEALKFDDFIKFDDFTIHRSEFNNEIIDIKEKQLIINKQLTDFENKLEEQSLSNESSFDKKISKLASIDSLDNVLSDLEKNIDKKLNDFSEKIEIDNIKKSLDIVIKDVGDIYRLAGEIDKEKISKLEVKTHEEFRKIKYQMNQIEQKLELQKDDNKQIKNRLANFITYSKLTEIETKLLDKTNKINQLENEINQKYNILNRRSSFQKRINIAYIIIIAGLFLFNMIALNNGFHFFYKAAKSVISNFII